MQRLDHFNGVTYVNEVIAIISTLCGSLEARLRAIQRACPWTLALAVCRSRFGMLGVGLGVVGLVWVRFLFLFCIFFLLKRRSKKGAEGKEGGEIKQTNKQTK